MSIVAASPWIWLGSDEAVIFEADRSATRPGYVARRTAAPSAPVESVTSARVTVCGSPKRSTSGWTQ